MRRRLVRVARAGVAMSAVLGLVAMVRYPGGDPLDRTATRYALSRNFLSDLGMTVAWNGQANRIGAALFAASVILLVASVLIILAGLVRTLTGIASARTYAKAAGLVGLMTATAFIVVALTPEDRLMAVHVQATLLAFRLVPVAVALLAVAAWCGGGRQRRNAVVLSGLAGLLVLYAAFLGWGPSTASLAGLHANVIAQKAVAIALVAAFLFLSTAIAGASDESKPRLRHEPELPTRSADGPWG